MMKQLWKYCLVFFVCVSCDLINSSIVKEETIVAQEKQTIDLDTVTEFPSFTSCDHLESEAQKNCFFQALTDHIYERLSQNELMVSKAIHDTIQVELHIDSIGIIKVANIQKKAFTAKQLPSLDSLIRASINSLPKASPANKRGIPVATKFMLPIILHVEE
ncbi:hypothetical protein H2O64_00750 [Kordia sp. YSTF-M3]|uniref:TonB C-terminal domain-containing protein n=1 Tax=Kordia aestuariivivens TaxID=2759037 RepID=A0ABR7Q3P6_9FLAO|nr:hypothetical protein [Kordia aestuariivivens]MBC8753177.1 hypothetical protein [Kordia aestuariivivens]